MVRPRARRPRQTGRNLMPATAFLSICGVAVFVAYEVVLRRRDHDSATWKGDDSDRRSTELILGTSAPVVVVNIAFGGISPGTVAPAWRWVGIGLLATGLAVRAWAMA